MAEEKRWDRGWDSHRSAQSARMASLPFPEKLAWLEQAQELALRLARSRKRKRRRAA